MSYPGGKEGPGVFQAVINQMPPHDHYVEAFLGGGAVLRHKRPATSTIAIDADPAVVASFPRDAVPGLRVDCCNSIEWLAERSTWKHGTLVYCDPPYLLSTRVKKRIYRHELSDDDHRELLTVIKSLPCLVMISGYWSELYHDAMRSWRTVTFTAMTRGGTPRTEYLWCNFAEPAALHDCRYVGSDYRERERIKRKAARWSKNFAELPAHERQVILSELTAAPRAAVVTPGDDRSITGVAGEGGIVTIGQAAKRSPQLPGFAA